MYPTWIDGDGGPTIVLQSSAAAKWDGTQASETDETDYDAICAVSQGGVRRLHRYDRDMLVLGDCEYSCTFLKLASGELAVLQNQSLEDDPGPFVEDLLKSQPDAVQELQVLDPVPRLPVGADVGAGRVYSADDCPIESGRYRVRVYQRPEALAVILVRA